MDWAQTYAEALAAVSGHDMRWTEDAATTVLDLARLVAHGTERRNAPLAAFLAGMFVAARVQAGVPESDALAQAVAMAEGLMTPGAGTSPR